MPSPTLLPYADYGDAIGAAATVLRNNASAAGLETPVPTCPDWTVRDLVVHQGWVHRWATDAVAGRGLGDGRDHEAAGRAATDLMAWFDDGATALLQALADAPEDLDVPFFLADAPAPRLAWCRRQAHETTIHAVDAMAARLGRPPTPTELWFGQDLALDGIDEILTGFLPRPKSRLRSADAYALVVTPEGTERKWTVHVSGEPPAVTRSATGAGARARVHGPARAAYLGLWNRGDLEVTGDPALADLWRAQARIG